FLCAVIAAWLFLRPGNLHEPKDDLRREKERVRAPNDATTPGDLTKKSAPPDRAPASAGGPQSASGVGQSLQTGATASISSNRPPPSAAVPDMPPAIPPATLL